MSWLAAVPVALICVGWLLVPGLLVTYPMGLRGLAAFAAAPVGSVAIISATAVVAEKVGVAWSVPLVALVAVALGILIGLGALVLRRRFAVVRKADPRPITLAAVLGLLPGVALSALVFALAVKQPDALAQIYDAVFHYNAVAFILDTHNASSLTLNGLPFPGQSGSFYPGAWHDVTSLVVLTSGASIPLATNMMALVVSALIWPLTMVLLVRQIVGKSTAALAITGLLSSSFTAFPSGLLGFGIVWPNLLGLSLAPAALAAIISIAGIAKDDVLGKGRGWALAVIAALAAGFAHPNTIFSLIVLGLFVVITGLTRWAIRLSRAGRTRTAIVGVTVFFIVLVAGWIWAATTPALATVREYEWPIFESPARAVGEALLNAPNSKPTLWALSVVVLIGIWVSIRTKGIRWLVGAHVASAFLFLLTASVNSQVTQAITGYWYNDSYRLAAMLPITGAPLAVIGLVHLARWLHGKRNTVVSGIGWRVPSFGFAGSIFGLTLVLLLVFGVLSAGFSFSARTKTVAIGYATQVKMDNDNSSGINSFSATKYQPSDLISPEERAFLTRLKSEIPADAVVADNPWDGSALLWALTDRRVLIAHFNFTRTPDQQYLTQHLNNIGTDPIACRAASKLNVRYLVIGKNHYGFTDPNRKTYPGFADPVNKPGFKLVDSEGEMKLYQITDCNKN